MGDGLNSARLIYFSPTGGTRAVVEAVAGGLEAEVAVSDITLPGNRRDRKVSVHEDIVIVGVPVYAQRIPGVIRRCLEELRGNGRPAVIICVYGNIQYGIALKELQEILTRRGFTVVAGAAFIARHSFSCPQLAVAQGRPDNLDMETARAFGLAVADKVAKGGTVLPPLPGRLSLAARIVPPNGERLVTRQPVADNACRSCGACVSACPVGAVDPESLSVDENLCLRCFACVRICPQRARAIKFQRKPVIKNYLLLRGRRRKAPELFL